MAAAKRICITGAGGMLGGELLRLTPPAHTHGLTRADLDVADPAKVESVLSEIRPDIVINAAAYTKVDDCETNRDWAEAVNTQGPRHLAQTCAAINARLIHVSTDYVFNGQCDRPWQPDDPIDPINVYGQTKAAGESAIRDILTNHVIVRASWVFSDLGQNFVKTMLKLASERDELTVVTDQVGSPTYAYDLAEALLALIDTDVTGTLHFANAGQCSWFEFAQEIMRRAGKSTTVTPTDSSAFPRPAARPTWSVLDTQDYVRVTARPPRPWQDALAQCLRIILQKPSAL